MEDNYAENVADAASNVNQMPMSDSDINIKKKKLQMQMRKRTMQDFIAKAQKMKKKKKKYQIAHMANKVDPAFNRLHPGPGEEQYVNPAAAGSKVRRSSAKSPGGVDY